MNGVMTQEMTKKAIKFIEEKGLPPHPSREDTEADRVPEEIEDAWYAAYSEWIDIMNRAWDMAVERFRIE